MEGRFLPKIIFRRSWLYDKALRHRRGFKMPSEEIFRRKISKLERIWEEKGKLILLEISKITKLRWQEKEITCYITAGIAPYSDPLTLTLYRDENDMFDTLTHELIHRIFSEPENWRYVKKNWARIAKKYKRESEIAKSHIVIHAIHMSILKKFFDEKRLARVMRFVTNREYIRSWEIVQKEGFRNLISDLIRG